MLQLLISLILAFQSSADQSQPLLHIGSGIAIKLSINGKPLTLALDSGSPVTFIKPEKAKEIGLKPQEELSNHKGFFWAEPSNIETKGAVFDHIVPVIGAPAGMADVPEIDGLLGDDVLSRSSLAMDFDAMTITVSADGDCSPFKDVEWLGAKGPVPAFYDLLTTRKALEVKTNSGQLELVLPFGGKYLLARNAKVTFENDDAKVEADDMVTKIFPNGPVVTTDKDGGRTLDFGKGKVMQLPANPVFDPTVVEIPVIFNDDMEPMMAISAGSHSYKAFIDLGSAMAAFPEKDESDAIIVETGPEPESGANAKSGIVDSLGFGSTTLRFQPVEILSSDYPNPLLGWTFFGNDKVVFDFCIGRVFATQVAVAGTSIIGAQLTVYGLEISDDDKGYVNPVPEIAAAGIAAKAGLKKGDQIKEIGGLTFDDAMLLGAKGPMDKLVDFLKSTQHTLTVVVTRNGSPVTFTLHRD